MWETSGRLLRLLSLLQNRRDWSGAALAERLGVTVRTVRRDMDRLRGLGYPVHATPGVAGGYRLGVGAALPPLLLDDDEAVAVAVGLRTAAGGTVTGIEETSVRALAKLEQMLPPRLRHRVGALDAMTVPLTGAGPTVPSEVLTAVALACRDHQRLRFDYRSRGGEPGVRTVEPHRLVHTGRRWYLVAWDVERADWRTFRVDRMTPRIPTGPRFTPREPPADVARYASQGIATDAYRYRGQFLLRVPLAEAAAVITPTSGVLEPVDAHSCRLRTGGNNLRTMIVWVAVLGFEFEVLDPPELVAHAAEVGARLTRAAAARRRPTGGWPGELGDTIRPEG
ncbi:helix-turn-helix transcriptional regulator [Micromonospora echinaurantiaca]|uniref:helix-turn-helix transcriptional regulator n=1 Tax=Micromonospora echinaurantiaca TaxID=47857 RepID=UPI0037152D05